MIQSSSVQDRRRTDYVHLSFCCWFCIEEICSAGFAWSFDGRADVTRSALADISACRVRIEQGITAFTPLDLVDMPYSHSLVTCIGWPLLFAVGYWLLTRYRTGAVVIALGVLSHWLLDYITHRPDMPLSPGVETKLGLGMWNSIVGTLAIESLMFIVGVWFYLTATRRGVFAFWGRIVLRNHVCDRNHSGLITRSS